MFDLDGIRELAEEGFDDILDQLGKPCKLVYPARAVECTNCIYDPIGKKSSNRWRTGGPMPFHAGSCPSCNGEGKRFSENSETITMTINWNLGRFDESSANVRIPLGHIIDTRAYIDDYIKIIRSEEMLILGAVAGLRHFKWKLAGEPADPFQMTSGRYCIAKWKRVG